MWFTFILCRSLPEPLDQKETIEVVSDLESSEDEHEELTKVVVDEGVANKWDCESILSECDIRSLRSIQGCEPVSVMKEVTVGVTLHFCFEKNPSWFLICCVGPFL